MIDKVSMILKKLTLLLSLWIAFTLLGSVKWVLLPSGEKCKIFNSELLVERA